MLLRFAKRVEKLLRRRFMDGDNYARWSGVKVGKRCRILTREFGTEPFLIEIGDDVTISTDVLFLTHDGATWLVRDENGRRQRISRIRIGNWAFVGARAVLMPGVSIGSRCIVGAGSVVTRSVPDGWVVAGNPARKITTFDDYRRKALDYPDATMFSGKTHRERCLRVVSEEYSPLMR